MILRETKLLLTVLADIGENIAADELNKQGFDAVTIEGDYSAWKDELRKKQENSNNSNE
jgi:hypothetical protein